MAVLHGIALLERSSGVNGLGFVYSFDGEVVRYWLVFVIVSHMFASVLDVMHVNDETCSQFTRRS